ncbi:MAG: hypothetical protein J0H49_18295 [Acidobacteria bacterium]|nr:hypothetical protein [Acidobacteriota bacterium]
MISNRCIGPFLICAAWTTGFCVDAGQSGFPARIERAGDRMRIRIESGRPLAAAADSLEAEYGWQINYEDPESFCPREVIEVVDTRKPPAGTGGRVLVPKPVRFNPTYAQPLNPPTTSERRATIARVLEAARREIALNYTYLESDGSIDLIPSGFFDEDCKFVTRASLMDTRIYLPPGPRNFDRALHEFVAALSKATSRQVALGAMPANFLYQTQLPLGAMGGPARSVLRRLIEGSRRKLAWQLLVDPGTRKALLNLHFVDRAEQ